MSGFLEWWAIGALETRKESTKPLSQNGKTKGIADPPSPERVCSYFFLRVFVVDFPTPENQSQPLVRAIRAASTRLAAPSLLIDSER